MTDKLWFIGQAWGMPCLTECDVRKENGRSWYISPMLAREVFGENVFGHGYREPERRIEKRSATHVFTSKAAALDALAERWRGKAAEYRRKATEADADADRLAALAAAEEPTGSADDGQ